MPAKSSAASAASPSGVKRGPGRPRKRPPTPPPPPPPQFGRACHRCSHWGVECSLIHGGDPPCARCLEKAPKRAGGGCQPPTPQAAATVVQLARAIHEDGDVRGLRAEYREYLAPPPPDTPRSRARAINRVVVPVVSPALAALRARNERTPSLAPSSSPEEATGSAVPAAELVGVFWVLVAVLVLVGALGAWGVLLVRDW